jgi:hypothetical protein
VSEIRILGMSGPKREKVAGGWRRLHNEEIHDLYASPVIIRGTGHVAHMGEIRNTYKILIGIPEGKKPFEKT